jgi:transmembrane 9 superfamily protein 3
VPIKDGKQLEFTYAVEWVETNTTFARRFDAYLDYPFFEHQVNPSCFIPLSCKFFPAILLNTCILISIHMWVTQIHWFSIFNSFMMVIFLTGLVSMILMRTLRNDYAKYAREEDDLETLVSQIPHNHHL